MADADAKHASVCVWVVGGGWISHNARALRLGFTKVRYLSKNARSRLIVVIVLGREEGRGGEGCC